VAIILTTSVAPLRRLLARAEAEQVALERRLADAGEAEGRYLTELRDLEAAVADR